MEFPRILEIINLGTEIIYTLFDTPHSVAGSVSCPQPPSVSTEIVTTFKTIILWIRFRLRVALLLLVAQSSVQCPVKFVSVRQRNCGYIQTIRYCYSFLLWALALTNRDQGRQGDTGDSPKFAGRPQI